jgi:hypothetical protein
MAGKNFSQLPAKLNIKPIAAVDMAQNNFYVSWYALKLEKVGFKCSLPLRRVHEIKLTYLASRTILLLALIQYYDMIHMHRLAV